MAIDFGEALDFLEALWGLYSSSSELFFEVLIIYRDGRVSVEFFSGVDAPRRAVEWLRRVEERIAREGASVYFGVLPRDRRPERGRGRSSDVSRGAWLWADLDFKRVVRDPSEAPIPREAVEVALREGRWFEELEDHALKAMYREGDKWIFVERPPLSKILAVVRERIGVEPTIVVDSGNGYHLYFRLIHEIDARELSELERLLVDALGADPKSKDLARVLRLPGTINPRIGRLARVITINPVEVDPSELKRVLKEALSKDRKTEARITASTSSRLRRLSDSEILEIANALKEAYRPGNRQSMCLYLAGWGAKARIHPVSIATIIRILHDDTNDEEPLEQRLSTISYSYRKAGLWSDDIRAEMSRLAEEWGLDERRLYIDREEIEGEVKGKSGIQEILERELGEERALEIVRRIEEVFGAASPFRDSIFELLDYEKQLYAVANLRRLIIARVRRKDDRLIYKERVAPVAPTKVVVYVNPIGGVTKYEVTFEGQTLRRPLTVGPTTLEDIVSRLRAEGLVYHRRLIEDVLSALIQGYIRKGRAEIREEIEAPGFYLINGEVRAVRWSPREVSIDELRDALALLDELASQWFSHALDRFATIVKWGLVAPFGYVMKQMGKWIPWLYLYGASYTGKSTLGEIVLHIWGLEISKHRKSGGNIDTVPRLGHVISQTTFPILVNEPGSAIYREDVVEVMKAAIEGTIVRGKFVRGSYIDVPSLAPLIMTSNKCVPRDDALLRRLIVLKFSFGERISMDRAREFEARVKGRLTRLSAIGSWVARKILCNPSLLEMDWMDLAEELLRQAYREAGLEPPQWIELRYASDEDPYEDVREAIRNFLVKRINDEFNRFVGKVVVDKGEGLSIVPRTEIGFEDRVRIVLEERLLPWATLRNETVYITTGFVNELRDVIGDIGGLKSIAELLGWEYKRNVKIGKRVCQAIVVKVNDFIQFLTD